MAIYRHYGWQKWFRRHWLTLKWGSILALSGTFIVLVGMQHHAVFFFYLGILAFLLLIIIIAGIRNPGS